MSSPLSAEQVRALALEAMEHTPEHTHFSARTKFSWVWFGGLDEDEFPEVTDAIAVELASRYRIYRTEEEIPSELVTDDEMGARLLGGFVFTVEIKKISESVISVTYSDYEDPLAAGRQTITYRWTGRKWKSISVGALVVS